MTNFFQAAIEAQRAALDSYKADVAQLGAMEKRLVAQHNEKRAKLTNCKSAATGEELIAQCKTLEAQVEKVRAEERESEKRFHAKIDSTHEVIVQNFKGLAAYAVGTGNATAGVRYLYDECLSFDKAKGNLEARKACFDSVCNISAAIAPPEDEYDSSSVLRDLESIEDPEMRSHFFTEHKNEIHRAYDSQINRTTKQEGGSTGNTASQDTI